MDLGEARFFIALGMGAVMLGIPLQAHAVALQALQDIRPSVLQLLVATHAPSINALRIENKNKGANGPFIFSTGFIGDVVIADN